MKKKLFILREASAEHMAQLEYYDSERKFYMASLAKRAIQLKSCFSINAKSDKKNKYAIALFTKDDCFSIVCDSEKERSEWLGAMQELQAEEDDSDEPRPYFEHIWPVTVKPKGLGNGKVVSPTTYRLCLTNQTLSLIRPHEDKSHIVFQFSSIRRCGHSDCFFLMELGRSSVTGAGELWMQVEDTVIAQNMHEAILNQMKSANSSAETVASHRPRSRSSASDKKSSRPINMPSTRYNSATLPVTRSQTMSASDRTHSPIIRRQSQSPGMSSTLRARHSVISHSPVTPSSIPHSDPVAQEEQSQYFLMTLPTEKDFSASSSHDIPDSGGTPYMKMEPTALHHPSTPGGSMSGSLPVSTCGDGDEYMDMSPVSSQPASSSYLEMATSISSTSSGHDPDELNYLDMTPMSHALPTVQEKLTNDDGYLNMSPGNSYSPQLMGSGTNLRPDKAYSYLSEDVVSDEFPKRAYSVGSKPVAFRAKLLKQSYVEMHSGGSSGTGSHGSIEKVAQKCSSAPHLPDPCLDPRTRRQSHEVRSASTWGGVRKEDTPELFMEFDFVRQHYDGVTGAGGDFRPRTSSGGPRELRLRASSFGHEMPLRQRLGSASTAKAMVRTTSIGKQDYHRNRTSTICQETLHPRTSSFGHGDMRPRSSSYSNTRQQKVSRENSRHSSQESLKALSKKTSQESVNSSASIDYLEMSASLSRSPSRALEATFKSPNSGKYSEKTLRFSSDEYMAMEAAPAEAPPTRSVVHHQSLERPSKRRAKGRRKPTSMMKSSGSSSDSLSSQSRGSSSSDTTSKVTSSGGKGSDGEYVDINYSKAIASRVSPDGVVSGSGRRRTNSSLRPPHSGASHDDSYVAYSPGSTTRNSAAQRPLVLEKVASVVHDDIPRSASTAGKPATTTTHSGGKPVKHDYVNVGFAHIPSPTCPSPVAASGVHSKTIPDPPVESSLRSKTIPDPPVVANPRSKTISEPPTKLSIHSKCTPEPPVESSVHSATPLEPSNIHSATPPTPQGMSVVQLPTSVPHRRTPPTKPIPVPPNMRKDSNKKKRDDASETSDSPTGVLPHSDSSNSCSVKKSSSLSFTTPAPFSPCLSPVTPKSQDATQSSTLPPFDLGVPVVTTDPFNIVHGSNTAPVTIPSDNASVAPSSPVVVTTSATTSMPPPFDLTVASTATSSTLPPPFNIALSCPASPRGQLTVTAMTPSSGKALVKSESGSDIAGRPTRYAKLTSRGSTGSLMSMSTMPVVGSERPLAVSYDTSGVPHRSSVSCLLTLDVGSSRKSLNSPQVSAPSSEHSLLGSRHSSKGSICAADSQQPELHYATLDLSTPADNGDKSQQVKDFYLPPAVDDNDAPLSYAQIDFVKSEELKMAHKEKRLPFEL